MQLNEDLSTIVRDMDRNNPESIESSIDEFVNALRDVADPLFCKKTCTFQCTHGFPESSPNCMCDDCKSLRNLFYKPLNQSNFYSANISGKARLSGATAKSVFNRKIAQIS